MSKTISLVLMGILAIIQLWVPARMISHLEEVRMEGEEFKFITVPVDPNDPFRGKYVALNFKEDHTVIDRNQMWYPGEIVYLNIGQDDKGFAKVIGAYKELSKANTPYLKATVVYKADELLYFQYPFDRFYVEETVAPEIEQMYADVLNDSSRTTYALVSVLDGSGIIKNIMVDNTPIIELIDQK